MKALLLLVCTISLVSAQAPFNATNIRLSGPTVQGTAASVAKVFSLNGTTGIGETVTPTVLWEAVVLTGTVDTLDISGFSTLGRDLVDDVTTSDMQTTLGATTVGKAFFTTANPSAITFPKVAADNSVSYRSKAQLKLDLATTTNDSAAAGELGEYISSLVAVGSAVALSNATAANVTSISLTAGDWDVEGNVNISFTGGTVTDGASGISVTSATLPTDGSEVPLGLAVTTTTIKTGTVLPRKRISLAGTTTIYLVSSATFSAGSAGAYGTINARRVR